MVVDRENPDRGLPGVHDPLPFLAAHLKHASAAAGCGVGDGAGDAQLHFGASSHFTPQTELGADLHGALAHARQSPVSHATVAQMFRIDALAVVPDAKA